MSVPLLLLVVFFGVQFFSVPIFMAIGLSVMACILFNGVFTVATLISGLYQANDNFPLMAIPFFIFAGELMVTGGISKRLVNFAKTLVGGLSGGLAMVTIVGCMLFAAISGSGVATAAAIGGIMMPSMIREGYSPGFSAALTASASAMGPIIPPSIPFIIYGIMCTVSVTDLFIAGIIPGILMGGCLMGTVYFYSKKYGFGNARVKSTGKERWQAFKDAFWSLLVPIVILGGIYGGVFSPTEAAIIAADLGLVIGIFVYKEPFPKPQKTAKHD
jgi:C4-dicarboxylate transporter DctM subunit